MSKGEYDDNCITLKFTDVKEDAINDIGLKNFIRVDSIYRKDGSYVHNHSFPSETLLESNNFTTRKQVLLRTIDHLKYVLSKSLDDNCDLIKYNKEVK